MTIFRRVKICPKNKHLYPLRFFSVCLSVTFFLPAKFFLPVCNLFCMYVCNIFLSPMFSLSLTVYLRYLCLYFGHVLLPTSAHRERERDGSSPGRFTLLACQCVKYFVLPIYKYLFVSPWVTKNLKSLRAFSSRCKPVFLLNQVFSP